MSGRDIRDDIGRGVDTAGGEVLAPHGIVGEQVGRGDAGVSNRGHDLDRDVRHGRDLGQALHLSGHDLGASDEAEQA